MTFLSGFSLFYEPKLQTERSSHLPQLGDACINGAAIESAVRGTVAFATTNTCIPKRHRHGSGDSKHGIADMALTSQSRLFQVPLRNSLHRS
jgi:hypothetical protein